MYVLFVLQHLCAMQTFKKEGSHYQKFTKPFVWNFGDSVKHYVKCMIRRGKCPNKFPQVFLKFNFGQIHVLKDW